MVVGILTAMVVLTVMVVAVVVVITAHVNCTPGVRTDASISSWGGYIARNASASAGPVTLQARNETRVID